MSELPEMGTLRVRTIALDHDVDLVANLRLEGWLWLRGGEGMSAWGEAARVDVGTGPGRFRRAARVLERIFASARVETEDSLAGGPVAFGSFTFDEDQPGSVLVVPAAVAGRRDGTSWLTVVGDYQPEIRDRHHLARPAGRVRYAGSSISELDWLETVATALAEIEQGRYEKAVLARDLLVWSKEPFDLPTVADRLAARFPDCYVFAAGTLIGASPELLVARRGETVTSVVLAGSAPRFEDPGEDARAAARLQSSRKERREHELAVASVADPLQAKCAEFGAGDGPSLLCLENVQHLATTIQARCPDRTSSLDLAGLLHPTATVCGAPADAALDSIRRLEGIRRGRYAGPVGWVDARGDGEWAIALRCGEFSGRRGRLFAGAGIVKGSIPESELEETRLKLQAMQSALET